MSQKRYFPFKKTSSPTPPTPVLEPLTFYNDTGSSRNIKLQTSGSPQAITLQYNKNDTGWTDYSVGTQIELNNGDWVRLSGDNDHFSSSTSKYYYFYTSDAGLKCSGDVQSLMGYRKVLPNGCYYSLLCGCNLAGCTPKMTVTDVGVSACYKMYRSNNWTDAYELPATGLANLCYRSMFNHCQSLTGAPTLPATTMALSCYQAMFQDCTALKVGSVISATTLANDCFKNFYSGCSKLSSVTVHFVIDNWSSNYSITSTWFYNIKTVGTFYCPSALCTDENKKKDDSHVPKYWTVENI